MTNETFYYVYKITNTLDDKIYIGCHQTNELDDGYMGSGLHLQRAYLKYGIDSFTKEILAFYPTKDEMFDAEASIVTKEFIKEDSNYNIAEGGRGGHRGEDCYRSPERSAKISKSSLNTVIAKDKTGKIVKVSIEEFHNPDNEFVGVTKGLTTVKDKDGNVYMVPSINPLIQSGEYTGVTKGLAMMKDVDGNIVQVSKTDPRIKTGELVGVTKGHTQTAESNKRRSESQKGIKKPKMQVSCIHCRKTTILTNIIRWHKDCELQKNDIV
jgi:hypothetical protein